MKQTFAFLAAAVLVSGAMAYAQPPAGAQGAGPGGQQRQQRERDPRTMGGGDCAANPYNCKDTPNPLPANPSDSIIKPLRKYSTPNEAFPLYLPDEMKLIRAEALARKNQLAEAAVLINQVRTQTSSGVDEPVAGLPTLPATALDTQQEVLAAIAYERRYELFMQGLRWEDTRRFGVALTTKPTFPFLPLPLTECQVNPSSGC